jgi:ATP-dependent RNA helicase DDX35
MPVTTPPELVRSDISLYLLQLKALGIDNLVRFDFLSPPPTEMMIRALEFLYSLKALDAEGRLTRPLGINMAEVPVNPMMAAIVSDEETSLCYYILIVVLQLLNSQDFQCGEEILTIAAMTSVQVGYIGLVTSAGSDVDTV